MRRLPQGEVLTAEPSSGEEMETLIPQRASLSPPPEEFLGTVVGQRYRVESQLGKGGTAAVYLAEDQSLGRLVALKVLSPDLARSDRWVHRFRREARAVARLEHQNIVKIYDYGETASGLLYFVMEYLRGHSVAQLLQEQSPLPIAQVQNIALQTCRAIRAAHDERIIHRDLKPGNIVIVQKGDGSELVKVLDFGIAMLAEDEGAAGETPGRLTGIGQTIGTPEYMAPEQVLGELLDQRSDIYALGCILYELLTGDVPFSAEPRERVRYKHVFEVPQRPSEKRPDVPPGLEAICLQALEKSPDRRFQSMAEMELAIEREMGDDFVWRRPGTGRSSTPPQAPAVVEEPRPLTTPRHTVLERPASRPPSAAPEEAAALERSSPSAPKDIADTGQKPISSKRVEETWFDAHATPLPEPAPPRDSLEQASVVSAPPVAAPPRPAEVAPLLTRTVHAEDGELIEQFRAPLLRQHLWPWLALCGAVLLVILGVMFAQNGDADRAASLPAPALPAEPKEPPLAPPQPRPVAQEAAHAPPMAVVPPPPVEAVAPTPRMEPSAPSPAPRPKAAQQRRSAPTPRAAPVELPLPSDIPLSTPSS